MKRSTIKSSLVVSVVIFLSMLTSCKKDNPEPVTPTPTLTFTTPTALTCSTGCTNVATSSISSGGAITYSISDLTIATVNATTGAITPVSPGTAMVTATQAAMAGKNAEGSASYTLTITGLSITSFAPTFGGVGYSVVITGTNFDGTTAGNNIVKINGVQTLVPTNVSSTSLTVLVPKGATGAGDITVTVAGKTAAKGTFTEYATVTTLAGDGTQGWKDATGTAAKFYDPSGMAIDNSGHILVADNATNHLRSITKDGVVTTIAGDGSGETQDGNGTNAKLHGPWGITVDKTSGLVYISERGGNYIRTMDLSTGAVATYAGSDYSGDGDDDGTDLTNVQFDQPRGLALDAFGNVYVADRWFSLIREITSGGYVITLAGNETSDLIDGFGKNAAFYFPDGMVIDPAGNNLYVADFGNNNIRKVTIDGIVQVSTFAGVSTSGASSGSTDGTGTNARFANPSGLAIDGAGNLYVADQGNNLIRKITPTGVVTTIAGQVNSGDGGYLDGLGPFTKIYQPTGITVDDDGTIYVSDGTNRIRKIVP